MNPRSFIVVVILASFCVSALALKRRGKAKIKKSNTIKLPGCGCQNPLFNIIDCGCRTPVIDTPYALASFDIPCGFQGPVVDTPNYRYVDAIEINALGYLNPLEMSNYGLLAPTIEYITPLELPCGCQGPKCGCRGPVQLPAYPYGSLTAIEVPNCGCQEFSLGYPVVSPVMEIASFAPMIQVSGCGCLGTCGCQGLMTCGCPGPVCGCQSSMPCGCSGPVCGCQSSMPCGCSGPVCGCQSSMPCGCSGPVCGCQSSMPCGCSGPVCGCQSSMPCGCQGPLCGCQSLPCGCPGPMCGCQGLEASLCGCGLPGCQCGGKYLRQITLQPPFL